MNRWLPLTTFYISLCCLSFRRVSLALFSGQPAAAIKPTEKKGDTTKSKAIHDKAVWWRQQKVAKFFRLFPRSLGALGDGFSKYQIFGDEAIRSLKGARSPTNSAVIAVCKSFRIRNACDFFFSRLREKRNETCDANLAAAKSRGDKVCRWHWFGQI